MTAGPATPPGPGQSSSATTYTGAAPTLSKEQEEALRIRKLLVQAHPNLVEATPEDYTRLFAIATGRPSPSKGS